MRGRRRLLSYRDAVTILGGDSPALAAADQALDGALSMATGGISEKVLNVLGAQGQLLRLGRDLARGLQKHLSGAERARRTERLAAANAVLAVTAYFEALGELDVPIHLRDLELTPEDQARLSGLSGTGRSLVETLVCTEVPQPTPQTPYEEAVAELHGWYRNISVGFGAFISGLVLWDDLNEAQRTRTLLAFETVLPHLAVDRYTELYARLAGEVPEFGFWSGQVEHQATRTGLRRALEGVERALCGLSAVSPLVHSADALARGYRAALNRPILSEGDAPGGFQLPVLGEGYIDPDFRVRTVDGGQEGPAEEEWWDAVPVRADLTEFLAGSLTSVAAHGAPLLVLGQPGAGKSVLTRILAARLPSTGFLPVRVVLREVPAEADIQDQIEHAVRTATGERVSWPELVRAARDSVPVLLFDGFDELLQATGVSQSDYLVRVAAFMQREADQGRPVFALVTSRTAVADRARCPEGTVALRLESFRREHIESWLGLWNRLNGPLLEEQGLRPLSADVAARHPALASQPLLLLMLALYDAASNALQRGTADGGEPLGEAGLYEELLVSFARREVSKDSQRLADNKREQRVEQELQRLSLIAFGMLNRHRQWITAAEAEDDLTAFLGGSGTAPADFRRTPLDQAEIALGRFFFVQRGQAVREERRLATYEFLHATFGEYLAARLAVELATGLLDQRQALALGPATYDDDLLYVLLSYAPLSSRQMLRFAAARVAGLPERDRRRLGELLVTVLAGHRERVEHRHAEYRPVRRATAERHGLYEANLVLLAVLALDGTTTSVLFPDEEDPPGAWHRRVLLWRSAFTEEEWTGFALAVRVRQLWHEGRRELSVRVEEKTPESSEAVDLHWHFRYPPDHPERTSEHSWSRSYWDHLLPKMEVSGGTNDAIVRHTLEPVFDALGPAVTAFRSLPDGRAASLAHKLLRMWLMRPHAASPEQDSPGTLAAAYLEIASTVRNPFSRIDLTALLHVRLLLLRQLVVDAPRLPPQAVAEVLQRLDSLPKTPDSQEWTARAAMAALVSIGSSERHQALWLIYVDSLRGLHRDFPARFARIWAMDLGTRVMRDRLPQKVLEELDRLPSEELLPSAELMESLFARIGTPPPPVDTEEQRTVLLSSFCPDHGAVGGDGQGAVGVGTQDGGTGGAQGGDGTG